MKKCPFKEGDRIKLLANKEENWPEEIATVLGVSEDSSMLTVIVDKEYFQDPYDDGFRELLWKSNVEFLYKTVRLKFKDAPDEPVVTSKVWYDITSGRYIKPYKMLETEDAEKVIAAVKLIQQFFEEAEESGHLEFE